MEDIGGTKGMESGRKRHGVKKAWGQKGMGSGRDYVGRFVPTELWRGWLDSLQGVADAAVTFVSHSVAESGDEQAMRPFWGRPNSGNTVGRGLA